MFLPLAFVYVVRERQQAHARQLASAIRVTVHPSQLIPPPTSKPGDPPGIRGTVSSGAGAPALPPHVAMTLKLPAAKAAVKAPPKPAPPTALATYLAALHTWHTTQLAHLGAKAPKPPVPSALLMMDPHALLAWLSESAALQLLVAGPSRPNPTTGQPADQAAWLKKYGLNPVTAYPEWKWAVTGGGKSYEARTIVVTHNPDGWCQWYVQPSGAWTYDHHYGTGFDLGHAVAQATSAVASAVGAAAHEAGQVVQVIEHPFTEALAFALTQMNGAIDKLEAALPAQCRPFLEGIKTAEHFLVSVEETALDPGRIDWRQVADYVEAAMSSVPVLGTAVSDIIATGECLYDMLTSGDALEAALRALYDYIIGTFPGVAALETWIRPVFDVLVDIVVKHQKPTKAIITEAVSKAPASPSVGNLSPRSIAASLATFVVGKLGLAA